MRGMPHNTGIVRFMGTSTHVRGMRAEVTKP